MSFINHIAREMNCKIVYYGAALGGKTTNLQWICDQTPVRAGGKMLSLTTETDRTLFFDFLPLELGEVRGFKVRLHLYTVPGQLSYEPSRRLMLRGVDGVVLVADSQADRLEANIEALKHLQAHLKEHGYSFQRLPYVLQLNKRDLSTALPVATMKEHLQKKGEPVIEAVAREGIGVFETLREVGHQVLQKLKNE